MIELGKKQTLKVLRQKEIGVYLGEGITGEPGVLLPRRQVPEGTVVGSEIEVFLYKDSEDRPIATVRDPLLSLGELAVLEVVEAGRIGAFLNWGLERDLFLPYKEQKWKVRPGEKVLVALYVDKSQRLCATMKVDDYLSADSPYEKDSSVTGVLYEINQELGAFVAVDSRYFGLIPAGEVSREMKTGVTVEARVARVREDGKLILSVREKAYKQLNLDAEAVLSLIEAYGGVLPFTDKADPGLIKLETGLSKNAFKRAVGHLLKENVIQIKTETIELIRR
ncbi:CvfB family protein [Qiania dongpingensis]|uniref:S1 RNA-binding domain-containing protein n=1 Tax=Qiania dongpingensis TaxID=2763669 RepID=A0A7G9G6C9_9FIRM|nr:S1-like domain-containing RNA-binding protein [Qiania dongpingensis]QNM06361.1 S1 RNA-binding domain-containing protein [Qiania dongpingensis]